MKNEYLNEERYQKTNEKVKKVGKVFIIIGLILLGLGLIFIIAGLLGFGSQISNGFEMGQEGMQPFKLFSHIGTIAIGGFLTTPGLFITVIGLIIRFMIGNRREIAAYTTQQVMPIAQEGIEKMAPTVGSAVGTIGKELAKGITEGIAEAKKDK